jgi:hypothetical protein
VFENRVLMRTFRPNGEKVRGWWKLHNQELHDLHFSPVLELLDKRKQMGGACGTHGSEWKSVF